MRISNMNSEKSFRFLALLLMSLLVTSAIEPIKEEMDKVIEDELTNKLTEDLIQSLERKFLADLEKSVDMVLIKIKLLLQNGTMHIHDKMMQLQAHIEVMKKKGEAEVETCLVRRHNETAGLAEKALHQMVLCGYALIGYDPAQALTKVIDMKQKIKDGIKPVTEKKKEVYNLLKVCGHDHDSLKKVVKCVISKSPMIKTAMMDITGQLIDGVVDLTKLMAHGAMHEACLIEVIKTIEDDAIRLIGDVKICAFGNTTSIMESEVKKFIQENNATILDIPNEKSNATDKKDDEILKLGKNEDVTQMKNLIRRMLDDSDQDIDKRFKKKLIKLSKHIESAKTSNNKL